MSRHRNSNTHRPGKPIKHPKITPQLIAVADAGIFRAGLNA